MKILVCGGRDYADAARVNEVLSELWKIHGEFCLIHGGARGADKLAKAWAEERGLPVCCFDANWTHYRKPAGPIRNAWMVKYGEPDLVVCFPGGDGTADMKNKATAAGVDVKLIDAVTF